MKKWKETPEGFWKTKDKRHLKIIDMRTSHLFNALRHVERNVIDRATSIYRYIGDGYINELIGRLDDLDKYQEILTEYKKREKNYEPWHWITNPPLNGIDRVLYREDVKNGCYQYGFQNKRSKRQDTPS